MRIAYLNVLELNSGWGAEYFIDRGFRKSGHEPLSLDYRKYRKNLPIKISELKDFDLFFLQRGDFLPLELIEAIKTPRFYWATELIARRRDQDELIKSGMFDHVFVHSAKCKDTIVASNWIEAEKVSVLINGFDEETHKPHKVKKDIDVLFVGNITSRRRKTLNTLSKVNHIEICKAYGEEMVALFNRAKIVLNIHAAEELDTETRVFEALGSGAFLLSEPLSEENPFIPGKHYIESDLRDFTITISYYLENDAEREIIAACGNKEAWAKHSYVKRAEEIINIIKPFIKKDSGILCVDEDMLQRQAEWLDHPKLKIDIIKYIQNLYYPTASKIKKVLRWIFIGFSILLGRKL
jgi:Glycosyl transferases group 1